MVKIRVRPQRTTHPTPGGRVRRALVTLICLTAGGLVAGCGSPTGQAPAPAANTVTEETRYATADLLADGIRNAMAHKGTGRVTGTVSTNANPANFNCDFLTDPAGYGLDCGYALPTGSTSGQSSNVRMLVVHDDVFVQPATRTEDGKAWLRVDLSAKDAKVKQLVVARTRVRSAADVTSWLSTGVGLNNVAADQVDGHPATRYDLTVPLDSVPGKDSDPTTHAQLQALAAQPAAKSTVSVWVDPTGLPIQTRTTLPTALLHQPDLGDTVITSHFTTWAQDTAITTPPAEQVGTYPTKK